eukprot:896841-Amorphochlora_amoeboformis.AAC.2
MHVHGGLDANGSSITIWEKKDNPGFHWHLIPDNKDKGYHLISSVLTEKLLRVEDEKAGNGAKIVQWVDSGISNAFKMMFIDSDKKGLWNIVNKVGGKCLHNHAVKDDNGNPVTLWEETPNNPAFNWSIAPAVKPLEKVFLVNPNGKAISIKGGENKNGAAVVLATKKNTDAFKWFIVPHEMDKGYFRIESAHTGKVLHNHGGSGANGNPMTTWDKTDPGSALKVISKSMKNNWNLHLFCSRAMETYLLQFNTHTQA